MILDYFKNITSEQEVRSGMAEVIKHALISDEKWLHEFNAIHH